MDDFEKAYTKALKFLSFRPRSEKEVRDNLAKKKIPPEYIQGIIELLTKQKFLNDEEFTRMWVESRMRAKPRAVHVIKSELKRKGISGDIIENTLSNQDTKTVSEKEMAVQLIEKKLPRYKNLPTEELRNKLGQLLARKGFNWDIIKEAVNSIVKEQS